MRSSGGVSPAVIEASNIDLTNGKMVIATVKAVSYQLTLKKFWLSVLHL